METHAEERQAARDEINRLRRRAAQQDAIDAMQRLFEGGDTLAAWDAYRRCRADDIPLPAWVFAYLDDVAREFGRLYTQVQARHPVLPVAKAVAAALRMDTPRGVPTVFARYAQANDWEGLAIAEKVAAYLRLNDKKAIDNVVADLAEEERLQLALGLTEKLRATPSKSTVERMWKRHRASLQI
jgi:hypothetical protein